MKKSVESYHEYVLHDVMQGISEITSKRMFGGYGLYKNGKIFAIITSDSQLYFKVDEDLKRTFKKYESKPFVYTGYKTKKPIEMAYWTLPEEIMEDRGKIKKWIARSALVKDKK